MLRKVRLGMLTSLRLPTLRSHDGYGNALVAPMCVLCNKPLDSESIVEISTERAEARVLGKHHGAEELAVIDLGTREAAELALRGDCEDVQRGVRNWQWFRPVEIAAQ